jgi:hypothetical protein
VLYRSKHRSKSNSKKKSIDPVARLQEVSPFRFASFEPYREKFVNHFSRLRLSNPSSPRIAQGFKSVRVRKMPNQTPINHQPQNRRVRDGLNS